MQKCEKLLAHGGTALTSPASCWKTLRNCLSSSLSFCSAYTAGLRGGGFTRQETQVNLLDRHSERAASIVEVTHGFGGNKLGGVNVALKKEKKQVKQDRNDT